jgi:hypothetical protein
MPGCPSLHVRRTTRLLAPHSFKAVQTLILAGRHEAGKPHWSEFDRGGHFAATEQPELYVGDLLTFVGSLDGR